MLNRSITILLFLVFFACNNGSPEQSRQSAADVDTIVFDWQGHRGARGLLPENSIPAFLLALEFPKVTTLELDLAVSKDSQLIVSHEPWLSEHICSWPDGRAVTAADTGKLAIFQLTAAEIRQFDCGSRGNERFPEQKPVKVYKPLLSEVVKAADERASSLGRPLPRFNIEIKSRPEWDGVKAPDPLAFARLLLTTVADLGIGDRTCIQSFDPRALDAIDQLGKDEKIQTAFLVEALTSLEENLARLRSTPDIYSPHYMLVTANLVEMVHERHMDIIPWTVNDPENMKALMELGVDGVITDYPDRIP